MRATTVNATGICLFLALQFGCSQPEAPLPSGAIPFTPPPKYFTWWQQVEQCAGKTGDYAAVSWYVVPDSALFSVGSDHRLIGYWQPGRNSITIAGLRQGDSLLVRHEELHAILQTADHPTNYFDQLCGNIVDNPRP